VKLSGRYMRTRRPTMASNAPRSSVSGSTPFAPGRWRHIALIAGRRAEKAGDKMEQGRLTGPGSADDRNVLACADAARHVCEDRAVAVPEVNAAHADGAGLARFRTLHAAFSPDAAIC
jgi:hypothetical protein